MASPVNDSDADFVEAATNWNLEKLYVDLARAKGKGLTPVEKKILRGLLCGYSPGEISHKVYNTRNSSAVRVYLSNGIYKYIQQLLITQTGESIPIKNWSRVTNLLSKAGYHLETSHQTKISVTVTEKQQTTIKGYDQASTIPFTTQKQGGWDKTIDVVAFYGRTEELIQLQQWVVKDQCRLIALLGMGGTGKTALAAKLIEQVEDDFELIRWRSLRLGASIEDVLADLLQAFSPGQNPELPTTLEGRIVQLLRYLRSHRCLIVLDNAETILSSGTLANNSRAGYYREGYEGYGELFQRLGEEQHSSCLILTSREKPKEIALLEGEQLPVRSLEISGLKLLAAQEILKIKGLLCSPEERRVLIKRYGGNPLTLKIVATTIQDVFNGNSAEFIAQDTFIFGDIYYLIEQQFNRLSQLEKQVIYWLTIHYKLIPTKGWQEEVIPGLSKREKLEAFESLRRRCLIEKSSNSFTLPLVVRTYLMERLATKVAEEIGNKELTALVSLINPAAKDTLSSLSSTRKETPTSRG